jgi:hypothetical protein
MALASLPLLLKTPFGVILPLACLLTVAWLNREFYRFLAKTKNWAFAIASFPLHLTYFCCCGVSVAIALVLKSLPKPIYDREPSTSIRTEAGASSVPSPKTANTPANTRESSTWNARP